MSNNNYLEGCLRRLDETVRIVNTHFEDPNEELNLLEGLYKSYIPLVDRYERISQVIKEFPHSEPGSVKKLEEYFENNVNEKVSASKDVEKHPFYKRFKKTCQTIRNNTQTSFLTSQQFTPPIDPITKKPIRNPVKNRECNHIYELPTIQEMLKQYKRNNKNMRCPYIGCNNLVTQDSLTADGNLKDEIDNYYACNNR